MVRTHAGLDPSEVRHLAARTWKGVSDGSLTSVPEHLRAEVVSPVLTYDDLPQIQEVVRDIRRAGAKVNAQCGIYIHVDAAPFDVRHLADPAGSCARIIRAWRGPVGASGC